jgi:MoaA/NifB/PqqE/SkfB family radical SAM enzyme
VKLPHDKFCVLPWVSLETSPIGTVRPCCLAEDEIKDNDGNKYSLLTTDLNEVHNSEYMQKLRQEFLDGKKPQTCRKCWNEERSGRTSKRMHTLDRLKHIVEDTKWTVDAKPLIFVDFKLGNICNLKCRICGSWSSSTFAAEEVHFEGKDSFHYQMLKDGAWPRQNQKFWTEIDKLMGQVRYLEFTGGEPFMIKEHFALLQRMVDRDIAKNVEIHYNTNGTHFPEHAESIWKHFKLVEIAFSIDDVDERFEYQRANAIWSEVNNNMNLFEAMRDRNTNIQLQVCSTVNVFNVMYLEELANWIDQRSFDYVYWNMLHEAYYHSIGTLPERAKELVSNKLLSANVSDFHMKEFVKIVDFMQGAVSLDGNILRMKVADVDWRRQQDLRTHHPELADAIDYEGPRT